MQVSRIGRFVVGVVIAVLVGQSSIALGGVVAYWRFEEGPNGGSVLKGGVPDGTFYPGVADSSGNGNSLSVWSEASWAGYVYRTDLPAGTVPQTSAANHFSIQNGGSYPGMFTGSEAMRTMTPAAFTIEASFKPETGGYRNIVGRDSRGATSNDMNLAALYCQIIPGDAVAIKFADVSGVWHEAVSAAGAVRGFAYPDTSAGHWYHMAAVSDGSLLSLYLNDVDAGTGYQLVAQADMTGSSANTALTAGLGSGGDWTAGTWSVGRGLYAGGHGDRAYGLIDEVRISDSALSVNQFLFSVVPEPASLASLSLLVLGLLARHRGTPRG
jgi:xylan 1,4-beta-xylosidase